MYISTILKTIIVPSQMGAGTGHISWRYHMTTTKSFREYENTHMYTVRSTVTEREAREGILRDIAGEWNERSPLVNILLWVELGKLPANLPQP